MIRNELKKPVKKTVYCVRGGHYHSKPEIRQDMQQPLSMQGVQEAKGLLATLKKEGLPPPDCIVCAGSAHARETADIVRQWNPKADMVAYDSLSAAGEAKWFSVMRSLDNAYSTVMFVGDNPGIERFMKLSLKPGEREKIYSVRSGSCAALDMDGEMPWVHVSEGSADFKGLFLPTMADEKSGVHAPSIVPTIARTFKSTKEGPEF